VNQLELSLEKIMLTVIALCFASMICIPLIENGLEQTRTEYDYSEFESMIRSIDNGIGMVLNSTAHKAVQEDIYIPSGVLVNSSLNMVTYSFTSDSVTRTISRNYPLNVDARFSYFAGWYKVSIVLQNSSWITISFAYKVGS
jgi:hypothetical protein